MSVTPNRLRVMIVEDHPEYREVIKLAIEDRPGMQLATQVGSAERALDILRHQDAEDIPEVILLDLGLPGLSGLEALPEIRLAAPKVRVIVLTQSNREKDVLAAIQEGAAGYLLKSSTAQEIIEGIRTVANGGAILDDAVARYILDSLQSRLPQAALESALSKRELEILTLLADGMLKKEIAQKLNISAATVATYIRRMYEKLEVKNAPAAIAQAYRRGIFKNDR